MATENLIFQKDKGDTPFGYVYVNIKEKEKPSKKYLQNSSRCIIGIVNFQHLTP